MASLDQKQKRRGTSSSLLLPDRLTSLPDELVTRILSMLPTKDAATTQVLSKRMRRAFCWITTVDLDNSLISHCVERHPHVLERFSHFETFVDNLLHKLSQSQQPLTRFRLCLGSDETICTCFFHTDHMCEQACFPEPARLYEWISYPLAQCGLRELDLCFHVKNPAECKLPPEIFTRQSLEVLRLDINVEINGDTDIPVICLPKLKLLHLCSLVFSEDDFVTRLVSNCPVLEDLSITCWWEKADRLIITSNSLRRFVFIIRKYYNEEENSDLVHIDAPNLQYFEYEDTLAFNYILHLNDLVEASIDIRLPLSSDSFKTSFGKQLSLVRGLSKVKHLSLLRWSIEGFYYAAELKDSLPMFRNLTSLKLGALCYQMCYLCNTRSARVYEWISYPLAHHGLRELDLCFHIRNSSECKLPPEIFTRQSLEVLRLDVNVEINGDTEIIPVICLPNLKLLHLRSLVFTEDDFVTRLVSNCPVLEDLSITCWWEKADRLIISSNSLRRFVFIIHKYHNDEENSELVHIDTPNLQYFEYVDVLAFNYILHLNDLVEASINVRFPLGIGTLETSFRKQLSLLRALSNVKHLSLFRWSIQGFYYAVKSKDPLPMFHNLRTLRLGSLCDDLCNTRWDVLLLLIFHRLPLLEELVFQEGLFSNPGYTCDFHDPQWSDNAPYEAAWEALSWGLTQSIPICCKYHLKRIRIYDCYGSDQELGMMRFLLGNTSVLKEFVISMSKRPRDGILFDTPKLDQFKNTLENMSRASNSCSIIYSDDEPNYY